MQSPETEIEELAQMNREQVWRRFTASEGCLLSRLALQCHEALIESLPRFEAAHVSCILATYLKREILVPRTFMLALLVDTRPDVRQFGLRLLGFTDTIDQSVHDASVEAYESLTKDDPFRASFEYQNLLRMFMRRLSVSRL